MPRKFSLYKSQQIQINQSIKQTSKQENRSNYHILTHKANSHQMAKEEQLLLLDFGVSPFCQRVKIALAEKGVDYDSKEEDLFGGKSDLLLKSNPIYQKVPVLLYNGKPVLESTNIVYFIDENWPSPPLLPSCPYGRSRARFWADYIDKKLFETGGNIWKNKGEEAEAAKVEFIEILKNLEGALGEKDYYGGDNFGLLDIIGIPLTPWIVGFEKYGGFKVEEEAPKFAAWTKRCLQRESVAKAVSQPEKVCEFIGMVRKMHGLE